MDVSLTEARDALRDVDKATALSNQSRGYRIAAPYLILWGVIWIVGYGAQALSAAILTGRLWLVLDVVGLLGSGVIASRERGKSGRQGKGLWRRLAAFATVFLFVAMTLAIMHPTEPAQYLVFPSLVLGLVYGLIGVFTLPKFLWIAAIVSASAVLAFYFLQPWLSLCIAVTGGGGLVLGGLWMRRL
jgi:hypothetical protein